MRRAVALILLLMVTACGSARRPGAVSQADSDTYDLLLIAQSAIEETRLQIESGQLPDSIRPVHNRAVDAYNLTRDAWLLYRTVAAGPGTTPQELQKAVETLFEHSAALTLSIKELVQ